MQTVVPLKPEFHFLPHKENHRDLFQKAGQEAAKDAKPIDDFRASAEYRREMVKVLTRKGLKKAYEEAKLREWRRWK